MQIFKQVQVQCDNIAPAFFIGELLANLLFRAYLFSARFPLVANLQKQYVFSCFEFDFLKQIGFYLLFKTYFVRPERKNDSFAELRLFALCPTKEIFIIQVDGAICPGFPSPADDYFQPRSDWMR